MQLFSTKNIYFKIDDISHSKKAACQLPLYIFTTLYQFHSLIALKFCKIFFLQKLLFPLCILVYRQGLSDSFLNSSARMFAFVPPDLMHGICSSLLLVINFGIKYETIIVSYRIIFYCQQQTIINRNIHYFKCFCRSC